MKKYTIVIISVMVCLTHSIWGASEMDLSGNDHQVRGDAEKNAEELRDPARSNEDLNTVIAQACADTRGNGDV